MAVVLPGEPVAATPVIQFDIPPGSVISYYGYMGLPNSFLVSGSNLTAAITVQPGANFEVSLNGSSYSNFVTLTPVGSQVTSATVYLRTKLTVGAGSYTNSVTLSSPGAAPVTYAVTGNSIVEPLPITVTVGAQTKKYKDADPALTYSLSQPLLGTDQITGSLTRVAGENAGTYAITQGTLTAGSNYAINFEGADLTIAKRQVTMQMQVNFKSYGDPDPAISYIIGGDGFAAGDTYTGTAVRDPGEDAHNYYLYRQGTLAVANPNYDFSVILHGDLGIEPKRINVSAVAGSKTFGSADPATLSYTYAPALIGTDAFTGNVVRDAGENAGNYVIQQGSLALSRNYDLSYGGATFTINKKDIAITAASSGKTYGQPDPVLTYTTGPGLVNGDVITGALARTAGENVGAYTVSLGSLTAGGNYNLVLSGTAFTIFKRAVTIIGRVVGKVYGDADPVFTYISSGLASGDNFAGVLQRAPGEDVGSYTITQGTLGVNTPGNFDNYTVSFTTGQLLIGKKSILVTPNTQNRVFGHTDPPLIYTYSPALVGADAFSGALSRAPGENVGIYAITQGTLALNSNYNINLGSAVLSITKRPVTISANAATKTYGDADPAITYTIGGQGFAFSDTYTGAATRDAGEDVDGYLYRQGSIAVNTTNYDLTFGTTNKLTITPRGVTVTGLPASKTYGDADPLIGYSVSPALLNGDAFIGALSRIPGQNVGTYQENIGTLTPGGNYTVTLNPGYLTIGPKNIIVTAVAQHKNYRDGDPTFTYTSAPALVGTDAFTGTLSRDPGEHVGAYSIRLGSLSAGSNYAITYAANFLSIGQMPVTVTAAAQSKTYGDADPAFTYTISPALLQGETTLGNLERDPGENAGSYTINKGTLDLGADYAPVYVSDQLSIAPKVITVTAAAQSKTYGDGDPVFTYTNTPALVSGDVFTGGLSRDAGEDVGHYNINQGSLALDANYALNFVGDQLSIYPKTITVAADAQSKTYGDGDPVLTYANTPALVSGDAFTGALSRDAGEAAGSYNIHQGSLALDGNYTLNFTGDQLSIGQKMITVTAATQTKTYGDADPVLTYTNTPALVGTDAFSGTLTRDPGEDVGTYAIHQGSLSLPANYLLDYTGDNLDISQKPLLVTADAQSKIYGDADPALTYTTNPLPVTGDNFTGTLQRLPGEDVGTYGINLGSLTLGNNYLLSFAGNDLFIQQKAVSVIADAQSKTYGDADPTLTYTYTPALIGSDAFTGDLQRNAGEHVGTYPINQGSLALSNNYDLAFTGNDLAIGQQTIQVTADAVTKTYGDADPVLTYTFTPALTGSDAFSGTLQRDAGEQAGAYAINQGSLALSGDYVLNYAGNDLNIGAKTIQVNADTKVKTYGDVDPALTYTYTPALIGSDAFAGTLQRDPGENTGAYSINQGSLALSSNYVLDYTNNVLNIGAKTINVSADVQAKTYGDADPALTYTYTPSLINGDAFTGVLQRDAGENVGPYTINQGSLALSSNYVVDYTDNKLNIGQKNIQVTAAAKTKIYGDVDPALTYTYTPALVGTDAFAGDLKRTAGEDVGTYPVTQGTLALNNNYALAYTPDLLTIDPKAIVVTADPKAKQYGDADPLFTYQFTPALVGSDAFTGTLARNPGGHVGVYPINQGTLSLGNNYSLSYNDADLTIGTKRITIKADAKSKTYGDADPTFTYTYAPTLTGSDAFSGNLVRTAGENAGTYPINQGSLALSGDYDLVYNNAALTIDKKGINVKADAGNKTYGDADPALAYTFTPALISGDAFSGNLARTVGENVGAYSINQGSLALDANYVLTYTGNNFTIGKKTVNITAATKQKKYGDADPALTFTFAPVLVAGDQFAGSLSRTTGENVGNYPITPGSLALNTNYNLTFTGADLTIGAKDIDITATASSKTYGDADPALTYTAAQALVGSDAFSGALSRTPGENVGTYGIQRGSLALSANYVLHFTGNDFKINKKTLTVNATAASKIYGDADPSLAYTLTPAMTGSDALSGALARDAGENVGAYAIRQGSLDAGGNYTLLFNSANLSIGQRTITVAAKPATKIYGASDPVLGFQLTAGNLVGGDGFSGTLTRDAGENVGTYTIRRGALTAGDNYLVTYTANVFAITPATLNIAADAQTKVYGDTDPAFTYVASGFVNGDNKNILTGTLGRNAGEDAGIYAILQNTLGAGNNYTLAFTGSDLTIAKAPQVITWNQALMAGCNSAGTPITLGANVSSGLPVTYTVSNSKVATVNGNILTPVAQGGTTVTATQAGDANHEAATAVDNNFAYQLSGLVRPHWNDVLLFDNSSNDYVKWQWYKDGSAINGATTAYYGQSTALGGTYYVVVTDKNGNTSQTCPVTITAPATVTGGMSIHPNPAQAGATATITCNYPEAALQGAKLTITGITGSVLKQLTDVHPSMQVTMPNTGGLYIITLKLNNGQMASVNVMIAD